MTGSIPDPRREVMVNLASLLSSSGRPVLITPAEMLARLDAADEASGVRRVTEKDLLVGWLERVFSVLAADSPVGGVS